MHAPGTGLVKVESVKIRPPPSWGRCVEGSSFPAVEIFTGRTRRAEGPLQGTDRGLPLQSFLFDVRDLNRNFSMIRDAIHGLMRARVRRERSGRSTLAFVCAAGERSIEEVWSGADRRSRRQRGGRSVHRRDAMRNSSVPLMWKGVPAAKQREDDTALFLVKAEPAQGRSSCFAKFDWKKADMRHEAKALRVRSRPGFIEHFRIKDSGSGRLRGSE